MLYHCIAFFHSLCNLAGILQHVTGVYFTCIYDAADGLFRLLLTRSIHFMVYVTVAVCLSIYVFDLALRLKFLSLKVFWSKDTEEGYWNG